MNRTIIRISKADYVYSIVENTVRITDLDEGNMTVTNDAENVLTEIRQFEGERIESMKFIYRDSDTNWDTIIPTWSSGKCISVTFKFGE